MEIKIGNSGLAVLFNFNIELLLYLSLHMWVYLGCQAGTSPLYADTGKASLQLHCLETDLKRRIPKQKGMLRDILLRCHHSIHGNIQELKIKGLMQHDIN